MQVPLKYANHTVTGLEYLVSFGVGAVLVTAIVAAAYSAIAPRLQQCVPGSTALLCHHSATVSSRGSCPGLVPRLARAHTQRAAELACLTQFSLRRQKLEPKWGAAAAPALLAGLLWSAGNFFGIIATQAGASSVQNVGCWDGLQAVAPIRQLALPGRGLQKYTIFR